MPGGKQKIQVELTEETLIFTPPAGDKLTLACRSLTLETEEQAAAQRATASQQTRASCRLLAIAGPDTYARIDAEACFYLSPRLRVPQNPPAFAPRPVEIELRLHPDLFDILPAAAVSDARTLRHFLVEQNRREPEDPFFSTAGWLALAVTQTINGHTTGFRTLWDRITPSALDPSSIFSPQVLHTMLDFLNLRGDETPTATDTLIRKDTGKDAGENVEQVADMQVALNRLATQLETLETELAQNAPDRARPAPARPETQSETSGETSVAAHFVRYFHEADWGFESNAEDDTFRLQFQGTVHAWQCFALAREEEAHALFYSVVPQSVPAAQRPPMAELLTRANYALVSGNFEMDWEDGEVRFKTSLDAQGQQLTTGWLHNLVYANLQTMNTYLPAILAVANDGITPQAALESVEN